MNVKILDDWLSKGLCNGPGDGKETVCLEQAVSLCLGIPMTDHPNGCIAKCLPDIGIRLNDSCWSSNLARAEGVREFAFEQLNSMGIDELWFVKRLSELTIGVLIPKLFRYIATISALANNKEQLVIAATNCEKEPSAYAAHAACAADDAAAYAADAAAYATYAAYAAYAACAACAACAAADAAYAADEYLICFAKILVAALREAKTKAGLPLFERPNDE